MAELPTSSPPLSSTQRDSEPSAPSSSDEEQEPPDKARLPRQIEKDRDAAAHALLVAYKKLLRKRNP